MKTTIKKTGKVLSIALGGLILLFLVSATALQHPSIQKHVARRITQSLSERLDARFSIDRIYIGFFSRAIIEGLYIEDEFADTLLYAGRLSLTIGPFSIFRKKLNIKAARLNDVDINLSRSAVDSTFNFQFIIDAFSPSSPSDTVASPWKLSIGKITIQDTRLTLMDSVSNFSLNTQIGSLAARINSLDLIQQKLAIRSLDLTGSMVHYESWQTSGPDSPPDAAALFVNEALSFPYTGWDLKAHRITLADNRLILNSPNPPVTGRIDYSHLDVKGFALHISGFDWQSDRLAAQIKKFAFVEQSGFILNRMAAGLTIDHNAIAVNDFALETPHSRLRAGLALHYSSFGDLAGFMEKVRIDGRFDKSYISPVDVQYLTGAVTSIPYLDVKPGDKLELQGKITGFVNDLKLDNFSLKLAEAFHLQLAGEFKNLPDPEQMQFQLQLEELSTSYHSLMRVTKGLELPAGMKNLGRTRLSGQFEGRLDNWRGRDVRLDTESSTFFQGDIHVRDMARMDDAFFDLEITEFTTRSGDMKGFLSAPVPIPLDSLGAITYTGQFSGGIRDFSLAGVLCTDQGGLEQDIRLKFNKDFTNADYSGTVQLDELNLGVLLSSPQQLGRTSLSARIEGRGFRIDSLSTHLEAVIQSLEFNHYDYRNISIDGMFDRRMFSGRASARDEYLSFDFDGTVDLNDSLPDFRFLATIDTLDLHQLNFYPTPLAASAKFDFSLKGNSIDNLTGQAVISNLDISDDSTRYGAIRITLEARQAFPSGRELSLQSDFLQARITGDFNMGDLPRSISDFVNEFFPIQRKDEVEISQADTTLTKTTPAAQDFQLEISLSDPVRLTRFFVPGLTRLDTAHLTAEFDSRSGKIDLDAYFPSMEYSGIRIDSLQLRVFSGDQTLKGDLSIGSIHSGDQEIAALSILHADMAHDSLRLHLASKTTDEVERLNLHGLIVPSGDNFQMQLNDPLVLNGEDWQIAKQNRVTFGSGFLDVQHLRFQRNGQSFYAQSLDPEGEQAVAPVEIGFERFNLKEAARLANMDDSFLAGVLDGKVVISKPDSTFHYRANLDANELILNETPLGDLTLRAEPVDGKQYIKIFTQLQGSENQFVIDGRYGLENKELNLKVDLQKLQMKQFDAFLPGMIRDSRGRLAADLLVTGTADQPVIEGALRLDSISTFVEYLKGRYDFQPHSIAVNDKSIDFGRLQLRDESGQTAVLSGKILHQHWSDFQFDLRFNTPKFQFLNTKAGDNPLFYGKVLLETEVEIRGGPDLPRVRINAETLPGTSLTAIAAGSEAAAIAQEDFVIFGHPETYEADTSGLTMGVYRPAVKGIDLALNLQLLPEAELQVIIDPITGDKLICRGTANVTIEMDPSGVLSTVGTYTITRGSYSLNYENVVRRSFQIRQGGRIDLLGDPMESRFDITAVYTAGASLYPLIQNQVGFLTDAQMREVKKRADVQVLLKLKGDLSQPEISFDIQVPQTGQNAIDNAVARKLTQLREQENELNKQVFGLLLFNNFISEESSVVDLASTGENIALSSVSNFISNQLNNLANRYVKGVDLTFDMESYKTQFDGQSSAVTELEVQLSKQLFNDRLSIQVGGNFDLSPEDSRRQDNGFGFAGDFLLEYKLTESGAYRLRVFRRSDYDLLRGNETETGVGLIFKKSFGGTMRQKNTKPKAKE